jgi:23S rRNA (uracil1939-C5)-methyltransferase
MRLADPQENEVIIDAYCGIGTIALYLAQKAFHVHGIEIIPEAVENAIQNADENKVNNVSFHLGRVEDVFPRLREQGIRVNTVVLDPPRKGCDPGFIETLNTMNMEKIVYVSCNPATLARDIKEFCSKGFSVNAIQPVDQFPQTSHVECVVLMSRLEK